MALILSATACAQDPPSAPEQSGPVLDVSETSSLPAATRFTEIASSSGLNFHHFLGATGKKYFPEIMGSGCALFDYDNDGDLDAYLLNGTILEPGKTSGDALIALKGPAPPRNRLFRNELISESGQSGSLRFVDVTVESGAGDTGYGMGAATGDYDNDGDVDLYITNYGPDILLANNGDGTFADVTKQAGLGDPRWGSSAAFFDYDKDGFLDLFVTAYCDFSLETHHDCFLESGALDYCGPKAYAPTPGRLYRNQGNGRFRNVTSRTGTDLAYGHGLGIVAGDFDQDGAPDIYVANDSDMNQLWINAGSKFTDEALINGVAFNEFGQPEAGMGIAIADFDQDGDTDLFVTHLSGESNRLYQNAGTGFFEDVTAERGLGWPSVANTGFGVVWFDADNDGDLDLYVANGNVKLEETASGHAHPYHQKNQLMLQGSDGRYQEAGAAWGDALQELETSRGVAFGDLDNDGDLDLLISNNNGPAHILRNDLASDTRWMLFRVRSARYERDTIGATVRLTLSDGRTLTRQVRTDGSYLSASDPRVHFAWSGPAEAFSVQVLMPDGRLLDQPVPKPGTITELMVPDQVN
jgi:hypothetical protein